MDLYEVLMKMPRNQDKKDCVSCRKQVAQEIIKSISEMDKRHTVSFVLDYLKKEYGL